MHLKDIEFRIGEIANTKDLEDFKLELAELAGHIQEDEQVEAITSCYTVDRKWLLTITNKRLFLFYQSIKAEIYNIPKERIQSFAIKNGFSQADIILKLDLEELHLIIKNKVANEIKYVLTCLVNNEKVERNKIVEEIERGYYKCIQLSLVFLAMLCLAMYIYL